MFDLYGGQPPPDLLGRCVTDYVPINEITEDVAFLAPDAERSFSIASGKEYHSTLDAVWGFQQMENDAEAAEILAITTKEGVVRCWRFPFGPKQCPAIFGRAMHEIFHDLRDATDDEFMSNFFDDFNIGSATFAEHIRHLQIFFDRARKYNVKFGLKKSHFCVPGV